MPSCQNIVIRADAGGALGTGHIMRMIALAQAWHDRGGRAVIAACQCPPSLAERIQEEGIDFAALSSETLGGEADRDETIQIAKERDAKWIVVDGYHFLDDYHEELKHHGFKVLAVDDYGHCAFSHVDLMLNQNIQDETSVHVPDAVCQRGLLIGPRYILLRREFRNSAPRNAQSHPDPTHILITFGGVDPVGATLKVLEALNQLDSSHIKIKVLAGPANPRLEALHALAEKSHHPIEIIPATRDMPALYRWADRVISAGGSSCYEWMYFHIPGWVSSIAANQDGVVKEMFKRNLVAGIPSIQNAEIGEITANIESWLKLAIPQHASLVDGYGALRVAAAMGEVPCWVRPVRFENDAQFLFDLANDASVRSAGCHPNEIPWDEHIAWLHRHCLSDRSRLMIIESLDHGPSGQIRFHETTPSVWEIGVSIHPDCRKAHLAHTALTIAMHLLSEECAVQCWRAMIKSSNLASQRLFSKLGFTQSDEHDGMQTWLMHPSHG